MNANELADELEGWCDAPLSTKQQDNVFKKHADMLRQQQAEIEKLKDKCLKLLDLMIIREGQPNKPSGDWWKGDPTCGGLTENYGLGKEQKK
jgi:hypothetical protein